MSDQQKKGKKRPKSYYIKCSKQKRMKTNCLDTGLRGFLVTCNSNEKRAVQETYSLLNEYADQLYGPEQIKSKACDEGVIKEESDENTDDSEEDVEKALEREVQAMKETARSERRFQNVQSKASNCIFIKTTVEDPHHLVHAIFSDLIEKKVQKTRYAIRLLPISGTCRATIPDIEKLAKKLFIAPFETPLGSGLGYSTLFKSRNSGAISKDAILPALGHIVKELNPLHHVNYDNPDFVILVEIIRNVCCLGVVKDFFKFRKYNLHEIVKPKVEKNIKNEKTDTACTSDVGGESSEVLDSKEKDLTLGSECEVTVESSMMTGNNNKAAMEESSSQIISTDKKEFEETEKSNECLSTSEINSKESQEIGLLKSDEENCVVSESNKGTRVDSSQTEATKKIESK